MAKNTILMIAVAVILMVVVFHVDIADGQIWICNPGYANCNNGYCCPWTHPICVGIGKCCPLAYPIYFNGRCYRWLGRSIGDGNNSTADAVQAAPKLG